MVGTWWNKNWIDCECHQLQKMHWIVPRGADATEVGEFVHIGVGLSIDSDVRVDRELVNWPWQNLSYHTASVHDIVREVLPNTSTDQLTSVQPLVQVYRSINFSVLGELVNWPCTNGVGQNLSYHTASVHPNITVNGQSHANIGVGLSIDSDVRVDRGDIVREVLPNTSTDQLTSVQPLVQVYRSINFSVLGELVNWPCTNGVGQNLSYHTASVHPNITVNGQSHANNPSECQYR